MFTVLHYYWTDGRFIVCKEAIGRSPSAYLPQSKDLGFPFTKLKRPGGRNKA